MKKIDSNFPATIHENFLAPSEFEAFGEIEPKDWKMTMDSVSSNFFVGPRDAILDYAKKISSYWTNEEYEAHEFSVVMMWEPKNKNHEFFMLGTFSNKDDGFHTIIGHPQASVWYSIPLLTNHS